MSFLPRWARKRPVLTNYDFVMQQLEREFLYQACVCSSFRKIRRLFYRTDTHWNRLGATVARNELCGPLAILNGQLTSRRCCAGLARMLGRGGRAPPPRPPPERRAGGQKASNRSIEGIGSHRCSASKEASHAPGNCLAVVGAASVDGSRVDRNRSAADSSAHTRCTPATGSQ